MAKPGFASHLASSSSLQPHKVHRPNSSNRSPRSRPDPSRTRVLALLAALSATPLSALAHPLDPPQTSLPFLYPPFALQPTAAAFAKRSATPSTLDAPTTTSAPCSQPSRCRYARRDVPDKFAVGDDGLYHKTYWSLYGSCAVSKPLYVSPPLPRRLKISLQGPMYAFTYNDRRYR